MSGSCYLCAIGGGNCIFMQVPGVEAERSLTFGDTPQYNVLMLLGVRFADDNEQIAAGERTRGRRSAVRDAVYSLHAIFSTLCLSPIQY